MKAEEESRLKPANENPWYCLATLYGEQSGEETDFGRLLKNRRGWDDWRSGENVEAITAAFAARTGIATPSVPHPTQAIDFRFTHFESPFIFHRFNSTLDVDFSSAKFSNYVNFTEAVFGNVLFTSATFSKNATFAHAQFTKGADFSYATFSEDADFSWATFSESTQFVSATFSKANFSSATFLYVDFSSAGFKENADFSSANFYLYANFSSTTFFNANFDLAKFHQIVHFTSTALKLSVYFTDSTFSKDADFSSAVFEKAANFVNAEFKSNTVFVKARFEGQVPDFRGAKLHEATEWHEVHWPPKPQSKADAQDQVYAYEKLKLEMERLKKHVDEQAFFAKELRARRETYPFPSIDWILNFLYEQLSDYGQSIKRPVFWLFLLFALGAGLFALVPVSRGVAHLSLDRAAGLSSANIFPFLLKREMASYSGPAQGIGFIEAIIGLVLLFLLGLALRNKFRMK
jgi:uncharacterized protein YjbI with pentapeptide repeats